MDELLKLLQSQFEGKTAYYVEKKEEKIRNVNVSYWGIRELKVKRLSARGRNELGILSFQIESEGFNFYIQLNDLDFELFKDKDSIPKFKIESFESFTKIKSVLNVI